MREGAVADQAAKDAFWALHRAGYVVVRVADRGAPAGVLAAARRNLRDGLDLLKGPEREFIARVLTSHHEMYPDGKVSSRCSCGWVADDVSMTHLNHLSDELVKAVQDT